MKTVRVKYFKIHKKKEGCSYYFAPPSNLARLVAQNSDGLIQLKYKKLSNTYEEAQLEAIEIYNTQIKPYLTRTQNATVLKQSLSYIWEEFKKRRGIDCPAKGNVLLEKPLAKQTIKDYKRSFSHLAQIKNNNGKRLIDLNLDMIQPQIVDSIYLKLFDICKERWAHNGMDLLRLLFNFGHDKLGVLQNNNPFQNLRFPKTHNVQPIWSEQEIQIFNNVAIEQGEYEIGLAVRLNFYFGQRPEDFFNIFMETMEECNGYHYFPIIPNKTKEHRIKSFAPIPPDLYEEIKDRKGRLIHFISQRAMINHFLKVKKLCPINQKLTFRCLRNTAGTELANSGCEVPENMSVLGHLTPETNNNIYRQNTAKQAVNGLIKRLKSEGKIFEN